MAGLLLSRRQRLLMVIGVLGVLVALPVLSMAVHWEYATRTCPPINDISTDTENPPEFWDMPNPMVYPGPAVAQQQRKSYPDLAPLTMPLAPAALFELSLQLVQERDWQADLRSRTSPTR